MVWIWGLVNAGQLAIYDSLPDELRNAVEDVILNRHAESTDNLLALAERYRGTKSEEQHSTLAQWRQWRSKSA